MDAARAKEFIYRPITDNRIYISKSLDRIMEIDNDAKRLIDVFGVVDTPNGEKMFEMDFSYGNEPILMRVLVHKEFFMQTYKERELINLDK